VTVPRQGRERVGKRRAAMRIRSVFAVVVLAVVLLSPTTALAVDWEEWKFLIRKRPVAVLVAIPPLIVTSPFMALKWALSDHGGDEDEDDYDYE
jgi:hypothetical protein